MNPTPESERERRRFYRIDDEVSLNYRVVSAEELERSLNRLQIGYPDRLSLAASFATTSARMRRSLDRVKRDLPDVANYLDALNDKLDLLVQLMAASDADLADEPTHDVSLSANGLSFVSSVPIAPESLVEVKMLIFPAYVCILCFGTIVRSLPLPGEDPGFDIGIEFTHIRETDRELLMKHITQRQSAMLREARTALNET